MVEKVLFMVYTKEQQGQSGRAQDIAPTEVELTYRYGSNSLAFFGLKPPNRHFLAPDGDGLVNYRLVNHVAIVPGDPVCPPEAFEYVTHSFLDFCSRHGWRVAFYQASSRYLDMYRTLKLQAFKIGEEAILHPQTFTLDGSAMANVRTSCRRAERDGVIIHWYEGVPPVEMMQQLGLVSDAWLEQKAGKNASETGFSTGRLDELVYLAQQADAVATNSREENGSCAPRLVLGVATTSSGQACAFVTFTPIYGCLTVDVAATGNRYGKQGWGWALDLMRRVPDAPPGVMELLLVRAIERFRPLGAQVVSLGMVALTDTGQEMAPVQRQLAGFIANRLGILENRQTLFKFKQKFHPCWEGRYVVACATLGLPKVALALFRLRNYVGGMVTRFIS
jgi:lysylphosphatidylglycerol synthetase-like protein (DUF2156 family)